MWNPFAFFFESFSLRVNDQKELIYQHLMLQLILQAFELSFHLTMLAVRHSQIFLVDLNVLCLSNQNHHHFESSKPVFTRFN